MNTAHAIVSSAIAPNVSELHGTVPGLLDPQARLEQTIQTIESLKQLGLGSITLIDGSGPNWKPQWERALAPARVIRSAQHQFKNKGISEIYMLLQGLSFVPADTPLIKLSGRYSLANRLDRYLDEGDAVFRKYPRGRTHDGRREGMSYAHVSTIAYAVRSADILERLLTQCLREVFGYSSKVVGFRSLLRLVRNSVLPHADAYDYHDPPISIELGMLRAIDTLKLKGNFIPELGVHGISGHDGSSFRE